MGLELVCAREDIQQGLKSSLFWERYGTTEVVPFRRFIVFPKADQGSIFGDSD